ncbi:hypothetical protein TARUN_8175 [Trichoderma arundinaceum]|uniref:Uncharacterized protein n=1 Tax=Trichoderma arundinaceum TaxID=490622 RepID=A0A395NDB0_TRIAR|nr:hypothetical protein TARUN_8175 [Trichoderma arundinaceum]
MLEFSDIVRAPALPIIPAYERRRIPGIENRAGSNGGGTATATPASRSTFIPDHKSGGWHETIAPLRRVQLGLYTSQIRIVIGLGFLAASPTLV